MRMKEEGKKKAQLVSAVSVSKAYRIFLPISSSSTKTPLLAIYPIFVISTGEKKKENTYTEKESSTQYSSESGEQNW